MTNVKIIEALLAIGWEQDGELWAHPAYGGGHSLLDAIWVEFTDLRERVLAMEANAKMPPVVHHARGKMRVPISHGVGVEVVKGNL